MIFIAYVLILSSAIYGVLTVFDGTGLRSKAIIWAYLVLVMMISHQYITIISVHEVLTPQTRIDCNDKPDQLPQYRPSSYLENLK